MAKAVRGSVSSGASASSDRLRSLCTPAERELLAMSEGKALTGASPATVHSWLGRAREFRDKWLALAGKQSRAAKRSPRAVAEANARSHAKATLFADAVKRFESQLAAAGAGSAAKPIAPRTKTPKRSRVAGHRQTRAGLRAELAGKVATLNRAVPTPAAKHPTTPIAAAAATSSGAKKAAVAPATPTVAVTTKKKKRKVPPAKATAATQAIRFDGAKQRAAKATAKQARLKVGGLATRRGSHIMAAGKRSQARRDRRR
jgi:hypothetical protein